MEFFIEEKKRFAAAVLNGSFSHAYIVEGDDSRPKRDFLKFAAAAVLCADRHSAPCGLCSSCTKIKSDSHPDVHTFEPEAGKAFVVEAVRTIKKSIFIMPNESDKKIYLLLFAERMTTEAQNALLKFFEEPPESAVFFISVSQTSLLLPTVISRAAVINLSTSGDRMIYEYLKSVHPGISAVEINRAVRYSAGNVSRGERFLSEADYRIIGYVDAFLKIMFESKNAFDMSSFIFEKRLSRDLLLKLFDYLSDALVDFLCFKTNSGTQRYIDDNLAGELFPLSAGVRKKSLCDMIESISAASADIAGNAGERAAVTSLCAFFETVL